MFVFSYLLSLLDSSADTDLYLQCEKLGNEPREERVMIKEIKDEFKTQAKITWIQFYLSHLLLLTISGRFRVQCGCTLKTQRNKCQIHAHLFRGGN